MFGSFLPSLWSSKQPQSTRVEEPTLLCNHLVRIEFAPNSGIPLELQREISTLLLAQTFEEDSDTDYVKEAANEIAEVEVRGSLQDKGYLRVLPEAKLTLLKAEGSDILVAAAISAELGPQYWLNRIQFVAVDPDKSLSQSDRVLRDFFPLKPGDLLNVGCDTGRAGQAHPFLHPKRLYRHDGGAGIQFRGR
jgi:hypothetical protein